MRKIIAVTLAGATQLLAMPVAIDTPGCTPAHWTLGYPHIVIRMPRKRSTRLTRLTTATAPDTTFAGHYANIPFCASVASVQPAAMHASYEAPFALADMTRVTGAAGAGGTGALTTGGTARNAGFGAMAAGAA